MQLQKRCIVGALYYPPKPIETDKLLENMEASLDIFTAQYPDALFILAGDLNTL